MSAITPSVVLSPTIAPAAAVPARAEWVDIARGIGIVLVVYAHVLRGNLPLAVMPAWRAQDHFIYAFHMPLFFLLSGLFLWPSISRGKKAFLSTRWEQIVWPYLLWSAITAAIELVMARYVNSPITLRNALLIPLVPIEQYWFLYSLFFIQLLALAVHPNRVLFVMTGLAAPVLLALNLVAGPMVIVLKVLPLVIVGVVIGPALLARLGQRAVVDGLVLASGSVVLALSFPGYETDAGRALVAGLGGSLAIAGLAALIGRIPFAAGVFGYLGQASMAIYVTHTIVSAGARIGFKMIGIAPSSSVSVAACVVLGIALPALARQLVGPFSWNRWTGLGARAPRPQIAGAAA